MIRILVSACLLGDKVRHDGSDARSSSEVIARWQREGRVVPFCPEVAGGLTVPRPSAEISGGGGGAVLDGNQRVVTADGTDVSRAYLDGAQLALEHALAHEVRFAVLKDGSPSCGGVLIFDGSFTGRRVPGQGVTTALLERWGIPVYSENELPEADKWLRDLEVRDGL
jgi:uncharacterized protein YbbK (DUF523 family)